MGKCVYIDWVRGSQTFGSLAWGRCRLRVCQVGMVSAVA